MSGFGWAVGNSSIVEASYSAVLPDRAICLLKMTWVSLKSDGGARGSASLSVPQVSR